MTDSRLLLGKSIYVNIILKDNSSHSYLNVNSRKVFDEKVSSYCNIEVSGVYNRFIWARQKHFNSNTNRVHEWPNKCIPISQKIVIHSINRDVKFLRDNYMGEETVFIKTVHISTSVLHEKYRI